MAKYALSFSGVAGKFDQARAVLDAKTLAAMEASVDAMRATAEWTRRLVFATFALAVATVVITIIDALAD